MRMRQKHLHVFENANGRRIADRIVKRRVVRNENSTRWGGAPTTRDTRVRAADALDSRPTPSSREVAAPLSPVRSRDEPRARAPPLASSRFFPGGGGNNDPLTHDRRRCEASLLPRRRRWSRRSRSASRRARRRAELQRDVQAGHRRHGQRWLAGERCSTSR